ncbi:hypothetical protein [Nocardioides sp.]|uniref:hypothetical protein n=1 Tax=Nocardioides sp. TaxID=35761 RepID=UPI00286C71FE|nr:hypothetical protein [Nocardioides sp.]
MHLRPTYSGVVSTVALVVALSGTAYAAATITGADVKDGTLAGRDVRNNTLTTKDVRSLTKQDFKAGVLPTPGPGVRIEASGALSVPSGPDAVFEMDTEVFDTGGMYTAPDDFVTITREGTYLVTAFIHFNGPAAQRQLRLLVDDAIVEIAADSGADSRYTGRVTALLRLTEGQKVNIGTFADVVVPVANFTGTNDVALELQWMAP